MPLAAIDFTRAALLEDAARSYQCQTGQPLVDSPNSTADLAMRIFQAPFALAVRAAEGSLLYANRGFLLLQDRDWDEALDGPAASWSPIRPHRNWPVADASGRVYATAQAA